MVGETIPEVVVCTAVLTSCSISSSTRPPSLMRGVMLRIMPVLRMFTELTIGAPGTCTATADCVTIGTSSPTCRVARLLSNTIRVGEDTMFTSVMVLSALSTIWTLGVLKKLEMLYARAAADQAKQAYASFEALAFYELALRAVAQLLGQTGDAGGQRALHLQRFDILGQRHGIWTLVGRFEEAQADLETMITLARESGDETRL